MDKLLQPDSGLIIWTILTFVLLLLVLSKTAWQPILDGIASREKRIRDDIERAEKANAEAASLRQQYETQLAAAQRQMQDMVSQARAEAEKSRAEMVVSAKAEAERIIEKGRKDLAGETDRLRESLRSELATLSLSIAEKILTRSIDKKTADDVLADALKSVAEVKR